MCLSSHSCLSTLSILPYSVVGFFLPLKTVPTSSSTQVYIQEGPGIPARDTNKSSLQPPAKHLTNGNSQLENLEYSHTQLGTLKKISLPPMTPSSQRERGSGLPFEGCPLLCEPVYLNESQELDLVSKIQSNQKALPFLQRPQARLLCAEGTWPHHRQIKQCSAWPHQWKGPRLS